MHSRQLEPALRTFIATVAEHLRAEVAAGAEVSFEVGSSAARGAAGATLYCYRALTREFIAAREDAIRRLPGYVETARLLDGFEGVDRYLALTGIDVVRVKGRERGRVALNALIEEVFEEQTDFEVQPERLTAALRRLHDAVNVQVSETALVATLHGVAIASEELALAKGLVIARRGAIAGLPDTTHAALSRRDAGEHLVVLLTMNEEDVRAAIRRGRAVLRDLLRALRLFGDGRIALGGIAWAQVAGGAWAPLPLAVAGRANGTLAVALEQEDELRAFCSLVSRRAPHGNELAWALERFELGCERESPLQGLSDHLLALRALLEPEGYWSGMLPGRLAALCAMPADRGALLERASAAIELERSAIEGTASLDAAAKALADEIATHLKALLRDVICGHLSPDLAGFADDLLARELEGGEEAGADQAEGAASAAIAVKPRFTGEEPQAVNEEAQEADSEAEVQAAEDEQAQDGEPVVGPGRVRASARTPPAAVPSA